MGVNSAYSFHCFGGQLLRQAPPSPKFFNFGSSCIKLQVKHSAPFRSLDQGQNTATGGELDPVAILVRR